MSFPKSLLFSLMVITLNIFSKFDAINGCHFHNEKKMVVGNFLNIAVKVLQDSTGCCEIKQIRIAKSVSGHWSA